MSVRTTNGEGLTYLEWLSAAGAITTGGRRIDQVYGTSAHTLRINFSRLLRKAWVAGEDPTEYRNRFDTDWARIEAYRESKRVQMRAMYAANRLIGAANFGTGDVEHKQLDGDFWVPCDYRFRARRRT